MTSLRILMLAVAMLAAAVAVTSCGTTPMAETTSRPAQIEGSVTTANPDDTPDASVSSELAETATTTSSSTTDSSSTEEPQPVGPSTALHLVQMHPNGSQLFLRSLTQGAETVSIEATFVNGYDFAQTLAGDMTIIAQDQSLEGAWEPLEVPEGGSANFTVVFPALPDGVSNIKLLFNHDDPADIDATNALRPAFAVDLHLDALAPSADLPADRALNDSATSPTATTLRVTGLTFSATHIGVDVVARTVKDLGTSLGGSSRETYVIDDLGNRYYLIDQAENAFLRFERFEQLAGRMVFAGRVHPLATEVSLVINADTDPTSEFGNAAHFATGPYDLAAPNPLTGLPTAVANNSQEHPNGTIIDLLSITPGPDTTAVMVNATVTGSRSVDLNANDLTSLFDDVGNRYPIIPDPRNPDIELAPGSGTEVELVFLGQLDPTAAALELRINDRGEEYFFDDSTGFPAFRFDGISLITAEQIAIPDPAPLDELTSLVISSFDERSAVSG